MKKTYGIKSLVTSCTLVFVILSAQALFAHLVFHGRMHTSVYGRTAFAIFNVLFICGFFLFFFINSVSRYHFITINNGMMRFSSFNPLYKPIEIPIKDIASINYVVTTKGTALFIATVMKEIKVPMLIIKPEAMGFYADLNATWPQIQTTGPEIKYNKKPYRIMWWIFMAFCVAILIRILFRHH
jgi:hypothetical protein